MSFLLHARDRDNLVRAALDARQRAYAPHSDFAVGASLLTEDGTVIEGCNVENDSFGLTICAERVAVFSAVAQAKRSFVALAVASPGGVTPCGACRQVLSQFCDELPIFIVNSDSDQAIAATEYELSRLLPHVFDLNGNERNG